MLNLAPIKFVKSLSTSGGPISKVEYGPFMVAGKNLFQANAYLDPKVKPSHSPSTVYSNADGTGTHSSPMVARYMAISEAMERWALHCLSLSDRKNDYGFDKDPSSNGMSAYPGLFKRQARTKAYLEAVERYSLIAWWEGLLNGRVRETAWPQVSAVQIEHPFSKMSVVVLWQLCDGGFYSYGFAAGRTFKTACWKALIELCRSAKVLEHFFSQNPGLRVDDTLTIPDLFERRAVFFALPEGFQIFRKRLSRNCRTAQMHLPSISFDGEIKGPWSKYATVWRVVIPMPTRSFLKPNVNFFFW